MAQTDLLERNDRAAAAMNAMLTQEAPVAVVESVDILSASDNEAVSFTSGWETEG
ncbi:hypothetical protein [Micromonospora sp. WMMD1082]|uniref:hypothetical protein n=1 Tax=Micromonospora sp. WMMD1082 TaxID=3016104 RepID=UPI002415E411|nr:hypothetical protein [Micromonospora sp. WMMD1082]MDG4797179.1 hypothetical protein [Micromonospora sp. WMMD1082]